jgi:hypothetical protein
LSLYLSTMSWKQKGKRQRFIHSWTQYSMEMGFELHTPATLTRRTTLYPISRKLSSRTIGHEGKEINFCSCQELNLSYQAYSHPIDWDIQTNNVYGWEALYSNTNSFSAYRSKMPFRLVSKNLQWFSATLMDIQSA